MTAALILLAHVSGDAVCCFVGGLVVGLYIGLFARMTFE